MDNASPYQPMNGAPQADFSKNIKNNPFFVSLPVYIQETILQSGIQIENEQQLRQVSQNVINQYNSKMSQ